MPVEERMDSLVHSDTLGMISGSTNNETKPMDTCGVPRFSLLVVILFVVFVSMLAIILSSIAIGRSPKSFTDTATTNDDYVWTFAAGHTGHALEYIDERSGQLRGFSIDLVNAVCQEADKNCEIIWDFYENCWDSETGMAAHGGQGLLGRWYDGCTAWANTANRRNTFKFSDQFLTNLNFKLAIYTAKSKSGINWRDLTNLTVGFLDGWLTDDTCLSMYDDITGFSRSNARHYQSFEALTQAIASGEVDCGFMFYIEPFKTDLQVLTAGGLEDKCSKSSLSVMTRPDNKLTLWWNEAFQRIRDNGVYQKVCDDVTINHGHVITEMTLSRKCLED